MSLEVLSSVIKWSKQIPPESRLLDPLGLGSQLHIQSEFTVGITSVTNRMRYFTLLAWYREHFTSNTFSNEKKDLKNLERILILSSLSHHRGKSDDSNLKHVFNKTRFDDSWDSIKEFEIDSFEIQGYGKTYYNANLHRLGGSYIDRFGRVNSTKLTSKLASCLILEENTLKKNNIGKSELENLDDICVCQILHNPKERDILSKMLFGFVTNNPKDCDINDVEFEEFLKGNLELNFQDESEKKLSETEIFRNDVIKRRNTLLLFLRIIDSFEEGVPIEEFKKVVWDAIYFSQRRDNQKHISFDKLERIRKYWEFLQLNVYYIYSMESLLSVVTSIITKNPGIHINSLIDAFDENKFTNEFEKQIMTKINAESKLQKIIESVSALNNFKDATLDSKINESILYDFIKNSKTDEVKLVNILMMLILLKNRFEHTEDIIKKGTFSKINKISIEDNIEIRQVFKNLSESDQTIRNFLQNIMSSIVIRHIFESAIDFKERGTRSWIFVEEEGNLTRVRKKYDVKPRDNRWESILYLLIDVGFIEKQKTTQEVYQLTKDGKKWSRMI